MEKRIIGDYEVINAVQIGRKEIALCEKRKNLEDARYMCCIVKQNGFIEQYENAMASNNYVKMIRMFSSRIMAAALTVADELNETYNAVGKNAPIYSADPVSYTESIKDKTVVIDSEALCPEFRHATYQLFRVTGGFGAAANARGRTVYCRNIYDGSEHNFTREDILGTVAKDELPEWAKVRLKKMEGESDADHK